MLPLTPSQSEQQHNHSLALYHNQHWGCIVDVSFDGQQCKVLCHEELQPVAWPAICTYDFSNCASCKVNILASAMEEKRKENPSVCLLLVSGFSLDNVFSPSMYSQACPYCISRSLLGLPTWDTRSHTPWQRVSSNAGHDGRTQTLGPAGQPAAATTRRGSQSVCLIEFSKAITNLNPNPKPKPHLSSHLSI